MTPARDQLVLVAVVLLSILPFVSKAFHIDDAAFIEVAEQVRRAPLAPFAGAAALDERDRSVFAAEGRAASTFEAMSHPPLVPYLIASAAALAGGLRERPEHLLFAAFPVVAALSTYRLAARFTPEPLWSALAVVTSPVFVLSGQGLMTDMPMLALSLLSLAAFASGVADGSFAALVLAGVAAGLAMLTRYVAVGLVPLLLAYELLHRRRIAAAAVTLAVAAVVVAGWAIQNWASQGTLHVVAAGRHYLRYYAGASFTPGGTALKAVSDLAALGGALLPPVVLAAPGRWRTALAAAASGAVVSFANPLGLAELRYYTVAQRAALALFLAAGFFVLARAAAATRRDPARVFLLLWLAGALLSAVLLLPFGASRYLLPALVPAVLLGFGSAPWRGSPALRAAVAVNLALALVLAAVDSAHAAAYRSFARSFAPPAKTWFVGEWGFRHYMSAAGHAYLRADDRSPAVGDMIARAELAGLHDVAPELRARSRLIEVWETGSRWPFRLMSADAKAGFYSHAWGLLPWGLGRTPLERFEVRRVESGP